AENTFRDQQHRPPVGSSELAGPFQLLFTAFHIVMPVNETLAHMEPYAIYDAGMGLGIVYHYVIAIQQRVDNGYHALIAVIQSRRIIFADKCSQLLYQLFMMYTVAGHHTGPNGIGESKCTSRWGVNFPHLRMVSQPEIVI